MNDQLDRFQGRDPEVLKLDAQLDAMRRDESISETPGSETPGLDPDLARATGQPRL